MNYSNDKNKLNKDKYKKLKYKNRVFIILFRIILSILFIACFSIGGAAIGILMGVKENISKISNLSATPSRYTSIVYDMNENEIDRYNGTENREYVTFDHIPNHLKNAFIAIEDERFYSHSGIDLRGIARAVNTTIFGKRKEGASTITQQLIKNSITGVVRNTLETKLQEMYLAVKYEKQLIEQLKNKKDVKNHILEVYLNTIYLHNGLYGVKTASKYYFNKDVSDLTISESAVIAAITQYPSYYNPIKKPKNNRVRQVAVLKKMKDLNFITQKEFDEAYNDNVYERVNEYRNIADEESTIHNYFSDQVFEAVANDLLENGIVTTKIEASNMIYNGGLKIYTTVDPRIQNILEKTYIDDSFFPSSGFEINVTYNLSIKNSVSGKTNHFEKKTIVKNQDGIENFIKSVKSECIGENDVILAEKVTPVVQPQSAMIVIDHSTGQVRGIVGGRGKKTTNRSFNRATQATRQPGSTFKVLAAFAPAIDLGLITPGSILDDSPLNYKGYEPKNWNNKFLGNVTVREAIKNSMNVVSVKTMINTGLESSFNYLKQFGFTTLVEKEERNGKIFSDIGPATALGGLTDGVTQLEVTAAYGTIANNGIYMKPIFYTKVLNHDGEIILENKSEPRQVLKESSAYMLTDILIDTIKSGTAVRAKLSKTSIPVAGKTGTTQKTKDLTFVGFTPYYSAGVWLGYDSDKSIKNANGAHLKIWSNIMSKIHEGLEYKDFKKPNNITTISICADSGKLAVSGLCDKDYRGSRIIKDLADSSNIPKNYCDIHQKIVIDTLTGLYATSDTPEERKKVIITTNINEKTTNNNTKPENIDNKNENINNQPIIENEISRPENNNDINVAPSIKPIITTAPENNNKITPENNNKITPENNNKNEIIPETKFTEIPKFTEHPPKKSEQPVINIESNKSHDQNTNNNLEIKPPVIE